MRKVFAYIRVSTEEQARHGYSIEAQRQLLRDYATGHELQIVEEFVESHSAYKPGRPEFDRMIKRLRRDKHIVGVLCYKIDRMARNLTDFARLVEQVEATVISVTEGEVSDSLNLILGGVHAVVARQYSKDLSGRVSLGLETKAKNGLWPTYAPTGYNSVGKGISPDPTSGPLIRELLERYATHRISLDDATAWAKDRGLRSRYGSILHRSAIHKILRNPVYFGAIPWKGKLYEGKHEPLIDKATFDRNQERLSDRAPKKTVRTFPYRGLLTCGYCGCRITAEIKKEKYIYYRCTYGRGDCEQPYHRQQIIVDRFLPVIEGISMSAGIAQHIVELAREDDSARGERVKQRLAELQVEGREVEELRDQVYEDRLRKRINDAQWIRFDGRFEQRLTLIREEEARLSESPTCSLEDLESALELLKRFPYLFMRQSDDEKARLLQTVVSNSLLTAENLVPIYRKPFDSVAEGLRSGNWLGEKDSNPH